MNSNNLGVAGWLGLVVIIILGGLMLSVDLQPGDVKAQATNYSLRFYGHGDNDIDRVKILIDPHVPADVGGDFTIEFWMKANLADNQNPQFIPCNGFLWIHGNIIVDRDLLGSDYGDYGISMYQGKIRFGVGGTGNFNQTICATTNVADNNWHHIAVTRHNSDGQMRIYIDGQQDALGTGPTGDVSYRNGRTPQVPNEPFLVIGAEKHDFNKTEYPSYNGFVDELRISNSIRYTGNFTPPTNSFTTDGNTVALYHFDEGPAGTCAHGSTVSDDSGAVGGPSNGTCRDNNAYSPGPVYTTDTPLVSDTNPPNISNVVSYPLDTSTFITWNTNEPATSQVTYGISPNLSMTTTQTTNYVTSHGIVLTGLLSNTTYVYRVISEDASGNQAVSGISNFTTIDSGDVRRVYLPVIFK